MFYWFPGSRLALFLPIVPPAVPMAQARQAPPGADAEPSQNEFSKSFEIKEYGSVDTADHPLNFTMKRRD